MDETSGVKGDFHAPFCGSPGVRFPRATRRGGPTSLEKLRETEELFDVVWLPGYPLVGESENPGA